MKRNYPGLLCLLFFTVAQAQAQADKFTGTWQMSRKPYAGSSTSIIMNLQIGIPDQKQLYPAKVKLQYGQFSGTYEMLLVRKNDGQLGISRGKYPLQETPFKLGIWMWYLNGTLDFRNNNLSLHRKWIDKADFWMRGLYDGDEIWVSTKVNLREFLYRDSITLKKINNTPLADSSVRRILQPETSGIYLGIYDRIVTGDAIAKMKIEDQEKYDKDTVTLLHNGKPLFYQNEINDHNRELQATLDTGRNLFIFFADNYGGIPPNTGFLYMKTDNKEYGFDLSNRSNVWGTFLVADVYYKPTAQNDLNDRVAKRTTNPVATITVDTAAIVLELWDGEVQDGDSISLRLNGKWVTTGFPVMNAVQKIPIQLQPGENELLFMADNLGSITPNTAELRIRYGQKTQVLRLSTDMRKNNTIKLILK
ncbi:hypothetical protein [Niastella sp. OAS944]|uniref:hypothetical protein n=1 Tax=Niastella sp. OAS944 TaxID=2664089 RepID=UPI0034845352|nr:hypothetical protein [Chitinophagaceae bacterium OAS944]